MAFPRFVHRRNEDGAFDSFCSKCAVTIVSALNEDSLGFGEVQHVCDEGLLKRRAERVELYREYQNRRSA